MPGKLHGKLPQTVIENNAGEVIQPSNRFLIGRF